MNRNSERQPAWPYFAAYAALLALLALSLAVSCVEHPAWNVAAALAIAIVKAVVVMSAFMHLFRSGRVVMFTALCAIGWLCLLLGLSASDYLTRGADEAGAEAPDSLTDGAAKSSKVPGRRIREDNLRIGDRRPRSDRNPVAGFR
jgi:cytochrome c oxidase subunit 4